MISAEEAKAAALARAEIIEAEQRAAELEAAELQRQSDAAAKIVYDAKIEELAGEIRKTIDENINVAITKGQTSASITIGTTNSETYNEWSAKMIDRKAACRLLTPVLEAAGYSCKFDATTEDDAMWQDSFDGYKNQTYTTRYHYVVEWN